LKVSKRRKKEEKKKKKRRKKEMNLDNYYDSLALHKSTESYYSLFNGPSLWNFDIKSNNPQNYAFIDKYVSENDERRVAVFPIYKGRLLIYRKGDLIRNAGNISTPGGKLSLNDKTFEEAAVRHLREKANIVVSPNQLRYFASNREGTFKAYYIILNELPRYVGPDMNNIREVDMNYDFDGLNGVECINNSGYALAPISCIGPWIYKYDLPRKGLFLHFLKELKHGGAVRK